MRKRIIPFLLLLALLIIAPTQVHAAEKASPETISFYCHNRTAYVGLSEILTVYFTPEDTDESYVMTSSDESIVRLEYNTVFDHYNAYYLKPGTAVITVTSESGLTDQCTINVMEMETFALNETKTVTVQPLDKLTFEYPYDEYGDYVFFSTGDTEALVKSETKDANIYYSRGREYFTLDENSEFCRVSVYNDSESVQTYTVKLMKAVPAESITLSVSRPGSYYVGDDSIYVEAELYPENAKRDTLTWTTSDVSVVSLRRSYWNSYIAEFVGLGTATITVASEDGASATMDLSVVAPEEIDVDSVINITLEPDGHQKYIFTPTESGKYIIYSPYLSTNKETDEDDLTLSIYTENGDYLENLSDNYRLRKDQNGQEYTCRYYTLEANVTYSLIVENWPIMDSDGQMIERQTITDSFYLYKAVPAQAISLQAPSQDVVHGDQLDVDVLISPLHAEPQEIAFQVNSNARIIWDSPYSNSAGILFTSPGTASITAATADGLSTTLEITVHPYQIYTVTSGDQAVWHQNSDEGLTFEIDAPVSKFEQILIDLADNIIDPSLYTISEGSTANQSKIILSPDALRMLSVGSHGIEFDFWDGYAYCTFDVIAGSTLANPFTDVPTDSFYYDPVLWAVERGITNGLTETTFGPDAICNRAQVVTFLWRAAGCPEPTVTEHDFVDIQPGSFYEKAVLWAVENGITNGSDATHFNPNGVCNRAQVVTFLHRAFGSPAAQNAENPFADVPAGSFYEAPVLWAVEEGITNGISSTEFGPNAACNRAHVVTFLYRAYNN